MFPGDGSSSITSSPLFFPWPLSPGFGSPHPFLRELKSEDRGMHLINLLLASSYHVATGNMEYADIGLDCISHLVSPDGDTMQRIASYFTEALAYRILKARSGLYKALNSTKISSVSEEIGVKRLFFEHCPFLKLAYVITNQAIVEAMNGEKMIHIIDFISFEPAQWISLLQTLKERPEGPPHVRITGIHEQKEVLDHMAIRLTEEAEKWDIPFQFTPIICKLENLDLESLRVKTGEALAVSSVLELHSLLATDDEIRKDSPSPNSTNWQRIFRMNNKTLGEWLETDSMQVSNSPDSVSTSSSSSPLLSSSPKMETFLNKLWSLSPKVMVVTEQESNVNSLAFMDRLYKALNFYAALFDCLESSIPRPCIERQMIEKMLYGEEIKNIITCEGVERKERHEKLEKWILRLELAGFGRVALSQLGMLVASKLLENSGYDGYKIKQEENGCLFICWQETPLFSVSAWTFRRHDCN